MQAADLVDVKHRAHGGQHRGRREQLSEHEVPDGPREPGPLRVGLDIGARGLDQTPILHSRRTGALASAASQAKVDVFPIGVADRLPFGYLHHLVNAAARRIHLDAQFPVRRAGVQAQAAVNALIQIGLPRLVALAYQS